MILIVLLILFTAAFSVRGATDKRRPQLRVKPGESPEEAKLVLRGTYRVWTWAMWTVVGEVVISRLMGLGFLPVLRWVGAVAAVLILALSHALYRRLGYGAWRWILVTGHLSGLFALGECFYVLRREVEAVAPDQSQVAGGNGA